MKFVYRPLTFNIKKVQKISLTLLATGMMADAKNKSENGRMSRSAKFSFDENSKSHQSAMLLFANINE